MKNLVNLFLIVLSVLGSLWLAEKIAGRVLFNRNKAIMEHERYISLREHVPGQQVVVEPLDPEPAPFVQTDTVNMILRTDENGFIVTEKNHTSPDIKLFFWEDQPQNVFITMKISVSRSRQQDYLNRHWP